MVIRYLGATSPDLSPDQISYAAGLFDGEGCIGVYTYEYEEAKHQMFVQVNLTTPEPLKLLQEWFGGGVHKLKRRGLDHWKDQWGWRANSWLAAKFLMLVAPHLRIKREQAEVALAFQRTFIVDNRGRGKLSPRLRLVRQQLADRCKELKAANER